MMANVVHSYFCSFVRSSVKMCLCSFDAPCAHCVWSWLLKGSMLQHTNKSTHPNKKMVCMSQKLTEYWRRSTTEQKRKHSMNWKWSELALILMDKKEKLWFGSIIFVCIRHRLTISSVICIALYAHGKYFVNVHMRSNIDYASYYKVTLVCFFLVQYFLKTAQPFPWSHQLVILRTHTHTYWIDMRSTVNKRYEIQNYANYYFRLD